MTGRSRNVTFLAGVLLIANFALANNSTMDSAEKRLRVNTTQDLSTAGGRGGFVDHSPQGVGSSSMGKNGTYGNGNLGVKGNLGNHGTYGNYGTKGDHGTYGNYGTKGDHGTYGDHGTKGDHGTYGNYGTKGDHGTYGDHGTKGDHGTYGNYGTKGDHGTYGDHGTRGDNGTYGNYGTKGDHGTYGDHGTRGDNGTYGDHGTRGDNGTYGDHGTRGTNGTYGTNGTKGTNGTYGTNGTKGTNGTNGTYGTNGTKGTNGTNGVNGTHGTNGTNGTNGTQGTNGVNGTNGTNGTTGAATSTTGGEATGGTSTGGTSSTTGEATTDTSSTGTASSSTGFQEEEKNKLRVKLLPLFHLSFDYGSYIVNLTPHFRNVEPKSSIVKYDYTPTASTTDSLIYGDFRDGFQKTTYGNIEVGLGAQVRFWFDNATGVLNSFWAYVGVLPMLGKDTESVRYVSTLDKAYAIGGRWSVPKHADDLDKWDAGDSITYVGHGGIIFTGGAGLGPIGVGAAKLASGSWEVYVEKIGSDHAYVKMTRGKLKSFSAFANVSIINLTLAAFKHSDDGFSFLFDLSTDVGRKAYEDMIRGNVLASERFAFNKPRNLVEKAPVTKVETFRSVATGKVASKSLQIPIIWDKTYSKGRVNSFTTSDMHIDRNTARVHYGIFSDSTDSRFWFKHKEKDFMFYGAKYSVENWDTKDRMDSMFGTYSYAFRHEKSNASRLRKGIRELIKKTGLGKLMVHIPDRDLGYTGVEFNVNFTDENTMRLMSAAHKMTQDQFVNLASNQIDGYFQDKNDPYDYCLIDRWPCVTKVKKATAHAASKMHQGLRRMYKYMNSSPKAFAAAYGEFGEGMAENMFTFRTAMKLAGAGVGIDYLIEGTYVSMYFREWSTDEKGRWVPAVESLEYKGLPFSPQTRHSRARGMIIGNTDAAKIPHMIKLVY